LLINKFLIVEGMRNAGKCPQVQKALCSEFVKSYGRAAITKTDEQ
jgi:hypothetical protein